jgi:hypothetical protein
MVRRRCRYIIVLHSLESISGAAAGSLQAFFDAARKYNGARAKKEFLMTGNIVVGTRAT